MRMKDFFESPWLMRAVIGLGILLLALVVFQAGVYVGIHKADLSFRMGDNYYRALGPGPFPRDPLGEEISEANGTAGTIVSVTLPTFLVQEANGGEKIVLVTSQTMIRKLRDATSSAAITTGDSAIVIGSPNDKGEVEASFIRLLPPPPGTSTLPAPTAP